MTHVEIEHLEVPPVRLGIVGGGIIAFEFAYLFARLGSAVSVIELREHVLDGVDREVRDAVVTHAQSLGIRVHTGTRVQAIRSSGSRFVIEAARDNEQLRIETDTVLLAAGQVGRTAGLGLEAIGVRCDGGDVLTDGMLRTSVPHIWAAGDVRKGAAKLSMVAQYEGRLAARNALGREPQPLNEEIVPYMIGLTPPVAAVGLTEEQARAAGYLVGVHRQTYASVCPVGNVIGEPEGLVKIVFDATSGRLLGAHVFGTGAPELAQQVAVALHGRLTLKQAGGAIYVFPGLTYVMQEALRPRPGDP